MRKVEIWYQNGFDYPNFSRLRLVRDRKQSIWAAEDWGFPRSCCWDFWEEEVCIGLKSKVKAMHKFDKYQGYPKAIKIGEFYE